MQVTGELKGVAAKAKGEDEGTAVISGKLQFPYSHELFDEAGSLNGVGVDITFAHRDKPDEKYHKFVAVAGSAKATSAKETPADDEGGECERQDVLVIAFSCDYTPALFAKLLRWQGKNNNLMFGVVPSQEDAFAGSGAPPRESVEKEPTRRARQERMTGTEAGA